MPLKSKFVYAKKHFFFFGDTIIKYGNTESELCDPCYWER